MNILEISPSAVLAGFQGTTMRIAPNLNQIIGKFLVNESKKINKPIVFLFHPTEVVKEKQDGHLHRRSKSLLGYIFGLLLLIVFY